MIGKYNKEKEIQTFLRIGKLPPATATMFLYFPPPVNYLPLSTFCWSDVAPIALLFFIELYCTSCLSISTEKESSLRLSLSSFPVFVKLRNFVMTVLKLAEG